MAPASTSSPAATEALEEILLGVGLPASRASDVRFTGSDPVFQTRYKVATAGAAALGAVAVAMADIRRIQTGRRPTSTIDLTGAAASLRGNKYVRLNGNPRVDRPTVSGFYRTAQGRWNYFHCAQRPHEEAVLKVLGVPADKAQVAGAAATWNAFALEDAVDRAGGVAPVVRNSDEWRALPNTAALAAEPLVDIRRIGDSAPVPLPAGVPHALWGLKVLDLTRVLAGPTCGRLLAENGADVLKITCERHPDSEAMEWETGYRKRKTRLDLATLVGRSQFTGLLAHCDVFSQAYRPQALAGLGFGHAQVHAIRPGLVYASLNAFGYTGVWNARRGFDTAMQAVTGMSLVSGDDTQPRFTPVAALDYICGYLMTFGVLHALARRHEYGGSYAVNVSLARCHEWLVSLGLHDAALAETGTRELGDIAHRLVEVDTPSGRLVRLRPVIRYSEDSLNELIEWRGAAASSAAWAGETLTPGG